MMATNNIFSVNQLNKDVIQIYGLVNGIACRRPWPGEMAGSYGFSIKFFDAKKRLVKVINNEKDGTIRSIEALVDRISDTYNEMFAG